MISQTIVNAIEIFYRKGVRYAVLCPGSRSAPLTVTFVRHPHIKCLTIPDERSAGFIALGIAQSTGHPVVIVTTSGTAVLNLGPAMAEAYYRRLPLIALTADRPKEWIDQADGQTIRQNNVFQNFVRAFYTMPASVSHPDSIWYAARMISEAVNTTSSPVPGPVHVNVPVREPFYPASDDLLVADNDLRIINLKPHKNVLSDDDHDRYRERINSFEKVLIITGQNAADNSRGPELKSISRTGKIPVIGEITSNMYRDIALADLILSGKISGKVLAPELLITTGNNIISKNLKLFIRSVKPSQHWHIDEYGYAPDTFQSLTEVIPVSPQVFFQKLSKHLSETKHIRDNYFRLWKTHENRMANILGPYLEKQPFGDWKAIKIVMEQLPDPCILHLANSMSVRYASLSAPLIRIRDWTAWSNRGTSGIDGCVSTAIGHAIADERLQVLITGDQAFFYDRNALWHRHIPSNIRIVIINNRGGGIFRLIDGPARLPEMERYFEAGQQVTAKYLAADHGLSYTGCSEKKELEQALTGFFKKDTGPGILEIFTDPEINQVIHENLRALLRNE